MVQKEKKNMKRIYTIHSCHHLHQGKIQDNHSVLMHRLRSNILSKHGYVHCIGETNYSANPEKQQEGSALHYFFTAASMLPQTNAGLAQAALTGALRS